MSHLKGKEGGDTLRGEGVGDVGRFLRCAFYSKVGFCNIMNVNVFLRWMVGRSIFKMVFLQVIWQNK